MLKTIFCWTGRIEALSLLALFGFAMPLKYLGGNAEWVPSIGMIHGILFVLYALVGFIAWSDERLSQKEWFLSLFWGSLPFGTFWYEKKRLPQAWNDE